MGKMENGVSYRQNLQVGEFCLFFLITYTCQKLIGYLGKGVRLGAPRGGPENFPFLLL